MKAIISATGKELASDIVIADTPWTRIRGLLGRDFLPAGEGLLISPCKGIHTFFMKFSIDVVFLDKGNLILRSYHRLPPNRMTPICMKAHSVLELPAGTLDTDTVAGERIVFC